MPTLTPDSDITATAWSSTGANHHSVVAAISDADYSECAAGTDSSAPLKLGLSNPAATPGSLIAAIDARMRRHTGAAPATSAVVITIVQGASTVLYTSPSIALTDSFALYQLTGITLTGLTDWNDLRVWFEHSDGGADPYGMRVSYFGLIVDSSVIQPKMALIGVGRN